VARLVVDCLTETVAPFDPATATKEIVGTLKRKSYGIGKVVGDKYAAQWVAGEFGRHGISYEASERDRSAIYSDFLPLLTAGRARLLDSPRFVGQLANLERRVMPTGRDRIVIRRMRMMIWRIPLRVPAMMAGYRYFCSSAWARARLRAQVDQNYRPAALCW
jgi:hypothetical protein